MNTSSPNPSGNEEDSGKTKSPPASSTVTVPGMELLPCPFCGNTPTLVKSDAFLTDPDVYWWSVQCSGALCGNGPICGIQPRTNGFLSQEAAISSWNTRQDAGRCVSSATPNAARASQTPPVTTRLTEATGQMEREELEIPNFHRECFVTPWVDRKTYECRWYNGVGITVNVKGCILVPREADIDGTCILYRANAIPLQDAREDNERSGTLDAATATQMSGQVSAENKERWTIHEVYDPDSIPHTSWDLRCGKRTLLDGMTKFVAQSLADFHNASVSSPAGSSTKEEEDKDSGENDA